MLKETTCYSSLAVGLATALEHCLELWKTASGAKLKSLQTAFYKDDNVGKSQLGIKTTDN